MSDPLLIDGSEGEGGGQILRTALSLSVITARPFRIYNIRANRDKPGLRRQHLAAVRAAAEISDATVTGDAVDSRDLTFIPKPVKPGAYHFDIGSAGSTMLVLQTILPPLMIAGAPSTLTLVGGTHNFGAPPFDYLDKVFLPLVNQMGPTVRATLERHGFVPRGGGRVRVDVSPAPLRPLHLRERGKLRRIRVRAYVAGLPIDIARREADTACRVLKIDKRAAEVVELPEDVGPGNVLLIDVESEHLTELFTGFGQKGVRGEDLARTAAGEARQYVESGVPVGEHLTDQLLLPMALAGEGSFVTGSLSQHAQTNIQTIGMFLKTRIGATECAHGHLLLQIAAP